MSKLIEFQRAFIASLGCETCKLMFEVMLEKETRITELEAQMDRRVDNILDTYELGNHTAN